MSLVINLGAGKKLLKDAVNVDIVAGPGIDQVVDLSAFPWPWVDNSVDGILASHIIEHFPDHKRFMDECRRILKPGGAFRVVGPHASCIPSVGCFYHYRTFCLNAFDDYLSKNGFKTVRQQLNWWYEVSGDNVPKWLRPGLWVADKIISAAINLCPQVYENVFAGIIPCREVVWEGVKK